MEQIYPFCFMDTTILEVIVKACMVKYKGKYIRMARDILDEEWYDKKRKSISDAIDNKSDDYIHSDSERYNLILHNCQDYIDEVLRLAKFIAIQNNDSLEFE